MIDESTTDLVRNGDGPHDHLIISYLEGPRIPGQESIPQALAEYILDQNLGDLKWIKYAGGRFHAELAEFISIMANIADKPWVYICINNGNEFDLREQWDMTGETAIGAVAYLLHHQITALSSGFTEGAARFKQARDTLIGTMERTAAFRAPQFPKEPTK